MAGFFGVAWKSVAGERPGPGCLLCRYAAGRVAEINLKASDANYCYFVLSAWTVLILWQKSVRFQFSQPLEVDIPIVPISR